MPYFSFRSVPPRVSSLTKVHNDFELPKPSTDTRPKQVAAVQGAAAAASPAVPEGRPFYYNLQPLPDHTQGACGGDMSLADPHSSGYVTLQQLQESLRLLTADGGVPTEARSREESLRSSLSSAERPITVIHNAAKVNLVLNSAPDPAATRPADSHPHHDDLGARASGDPASLDRNRHPSTPGTAGLRDRAGDEERFHMGELARPPLAGNDSGLYGFTDSDASDYHVQGVLNPMVNRQRFQNRRREIEPPPDLQAGQAPGQCTEQRQNPPVSVSAEDRNDPHPSDKSQDGS